MGVYVQSLDYNTCKKAKCNFWVLIILAFWAVFGGVFFCNLLLFTGNPHMRDFYSYFE